MTFNMELYQVTIHCKEPKKLSDENATILFMPYKLANKKLINRKHYTKVNYATIEATNVYEALEKMFSMYNDYHTHYKHRSMSTSDVVVVNINNNIKYYYCDFMGFQELKKF